MGLLREYDEAAIHPAQIRILLPLQIGRQEKRAAAVRTALERECLRCGRSVVLSKGNGKRERLIGVVGEFYRRKGDTFGSTYQADIAKCFGTVDVWIAEIKISNLQGEL